MAVDLSVKELLEAGAHFGHQTRRWNPKMRPFIYTQRDGIHIIDLTQTARQAKEAAKFIADTVALGSNVLFVGTKKQAKDIVAEEAKRVGQYFVTNRWLGGMLTNFKTIRASIDRLNALEERRAKGDFEGLTKKERLRIDRDIDKLENSLGGIKKMTKTPGAVFLIDTNVEQIARLEANKLGVPVIALLDTNCSPDGINFPIAANDDAIRSIQLFTKLVADACLIGAERREIALRESAKYAEKQKSEAAVKAPPREREQKVGGKGRAWVAGRQPETAAAEDVEKFASVKAIAEEPAEAAAPARPEDTTEK